MIDRLRRFPVTKLLSSLLLLVRFSLTREWRKSAGTNGWILTEGDTEVGSEWNVILRTLQGLESIVIRQFIYLHRDLSRDLYCIINSYLRECTMIL